MAGRWGWLCCGVALLALAGGAARGQLFGGGLGGVAQEATQRVQWAMQAADRALALARQARQIENEARMLAMGRHDTAALVARGIREARALSTSVGRVVWDVAGASADFEATYPARLPPMTMAELLAFRREQEWLAREASRNSKVSSAAMMAQMEATAGRAAALLAAGKACGGQTCAIDVMAQVAALGAETQAQHLMLGAAHARAVEGWSDYAAAAAERSLLFELQFHGRQISPTWVGAPGGVP